MTPVLHVPANWPMAWWSGDNSVVRMSCPSCGNFALDLTRDQGGATKTLSCNACQINGYAPVQRAFDKVMKVSTPKMKEIVHAAE